MDLIGAKIVEVSSYKSKEIDWTISNAKAGKAWKEVTRYTSVTIELPDGKRVDLVSAQDGYGANWIEVY